MSTLSTLNALHPSQSGHGIVAPTGRFSSEASTRLHDLPKPGMVLTTLGPEQNSCIGIHREHPILVTPHPSQNHTQSLQRIRICRSTRVVGRWAHPKWLLHPTSLSDTVRSLRCSDGVLFTTLTFTHFQCTGRLVSLVVTIQLGVIVYHCQAGALPVHKIERATSTSFLVCVTVDRSSLHRGSNTSDGLVCKTGVRCLVKK